LPNSPTFRIDRLDKRQERVGEKVHTTFWPENMKGRNHKEDLDIDGMTVLKWILKKDDVRVWTGFIWLRVGTSGGLV
jgi:hypothetical protein